MSLKPPLLPTDDFVSVSDLEAKIGERTALYDSGDSSELVTTLPVPTSITNADKRVVYSIEIPTLTAGDRLVVSAEAEVTNDLGFDVLIASQLIRATSSSAVVPGTALGEETVQFNITPDMHHGSYSRHSIVDVAAGTEGNRFINFVAWSGSTFAGPGDTVQVEQDYGRLQVMHVKGALLGGFDLVNDAHAALTTSAHGGIVASSDGRLTNARTPTVHASSHQAGGSDPITIMAGGMRSNAAQSIPDATTTALTFDTVRYDYHGSAAAITDIANERLVIPVAGIWLVTLALPFAASAAGERWGSILRNGSVIARQNTPGTAATSPGINVTRAFDMSAGDLITAACFQSSGGALNTSVAAVWGPSLEAAYLGVGA